MNGMPRRRVSRRTTAPSPQWARRNIGFFVSQCSGLRREQRRAPARMIPTEAVMTSLQFRRDRLLIIVAALPLLIVAACVSCQVFSTIVQEIVHNIVQAMGL